MKVTALSIPVVCLLFSCTLFGAEPLAQQHVVVHKVRDLDDPAKAVCVGTPDILQLPSGRLIASMELWLKRPTSGDEGGIDYPNHCARFADRQAESDFILHSPTPSAWR